MSDKFFPVLNVNEKMMDQSLKMSDNPLLMIWNDPVEKLDNPAEKPKPRLNVLSKIWDSKSVVGHSAIMLNLFP